jgi:EAL and modified HD-GYP domain-containing signal transduction protein
MGLQEIFVARQPIFDSAKRVFAYELLFRSRDTDRAEVTDGNKATARVIDTAFLSIGIEQVAGTRPAFINFTKDLILDESARLLPSDKTIVEILEDVEPSEEIVDAIRLIKGEGYRFALDDFVCASGYESLLKLADIVKVDFLLTSPVEREELVRRIREIAPHLKLLAEKVEDEDEFEEAKSLGFEYFQGYFFSKPLLIARKELPGFKVTYLRILQSIHDPTLDYNGIEEIIKADVSLTTKLLRYINAAAFPWQKKIESVKQALVLLGENQVRKWVSIVALSELVQDKPQELAVLSVVRGRFCEIAGEELKGDSTELERFMCGILSMLDAMLDLPLPEALENIPISSEVRDSILGKDGKLSKLLTLAIAYEKAEWEQIPGLCVELGLDENKLPEMYTSALEWSEKIFQF